MTRLKTVLLWTLKLSPVALVVAVITVTIIIATSPALKY